MSTLWTVSVLELADKGRTLLIWICSGWRLLVTALVAVKESWTHGRSLLSWRPRHSWLIRRPGIQNVPVPGAKTQMWDELKRDSVARQVIVRTVSLTTSITGWLQPIRSMVGKSFHQQSLLVSHTKSFPLKKKRKIAIRYFSVGTNFCPLIPLEEPPLLFVVKPSHLFLQWLQGVPHWFNQRSAKIAQKHLMPWKMDVRDRMFK